MQIIDGRYTMTREEISNSIALMILEEKTSPCASAIDFYNHWAQITQEKIEDPDVASWALDIVKKLLLTDRKILKAFMDDCK